MHPRKLSQHGSPALSLLSCLRIVFWFAVLAAGPTFALAAEKADPLPPEAWQVNADRVTYDPESDEYTAEGNVTISR